MILFINTFITDKRFSQTSKVKSSDSRYSPNRDDVFKFMLSSLSVISWERVVIYYELDEEYITKYIEIDEYINSLFSCDIDLYHYRNNNQSMWQESVLKLDQYPDNQLIWFTCDDDHIFIDQDLSYIKLINHKLTEMLIEKTYVTCFLSHWPEMMALRVNSGKFDRKIVEDNNKFYLIDWKNADGISIINKGLLKYWWFENDYGDALFRRTDDPENEVVSPQIRTLIPYKEQVRHFDGYGHVGINPNECPPLFIPDGFFESQIKISSCKKPDSNRYVYLDVANKKTKAFSKSGVDIRCSLNDIPLFWKPRIKEIVDECKNNSKAISHRNKAVLTLACSDKRGGLSPIRAIHFLRQSYFREQNIILLIINSLSVWKLNDFRIHFINILGKKFPKVFKILYSSYLKLNK
jgi:hypothetical protein